MAYGIDARHKEELNIRRVLHKPMPISALFEHSVWVVSIAQLVESTDSAVPGGVVEVVSSIPAVGHKIFSAFSGIVDLLYLSIYI